MLLTVMALTRLFAAVEAFAIAVRICGFSCDRRQHSYLDAPGRLTCS